MVGRFRRHGCKRGGKRERDCEVERVLQRAGGTGDDGCGPVARGTESGCHLVRGGRMGGRKLQFQRFIQKHGSDVEAECVDLHYLQPPRCSAPEAWRTVDFGRGQSCPVGHRGHGGLRHGQSCRPPAVSESRSKEQWDAIRSRCRGYSAGYLGYADEQEVHARRRLRLLDTAGVHRRIVLQLGRWRGPTGFRKLNAAADLRRGNPGCGLAVEELWK